MPAGVKRHATLLEFSGNRRIKTLVTARNSDPLVLEGDGNGARGDTTDAGDVDPFGQIGHGNIIQENACDFYVV